MNLKKAKSCIAGVWVILALIVIFFLSQQTFSGVYGTNAQEVWNIFLPQFLPIALLIIGVMASEAVSTNQNQTTPQQQDKIVDKAFFFITLIICIAYYCLLFWVLISVLNSDQERSVYYKNASLPLTYFQPVAALVIGVFFQKKD